MKKDKIFKIINIVKDVVCWTLVACLALTILMFFFSKVSGNVPSLFGYSVYRVSSGSMEPELSVGDVILSHEVKNPQELKIGDIITFEGSGELSGKIITHEVIKAPYINDDGVCMLQTKGTANKIPDAEIRGDSVISIMVCELAFLPIFYNFFLSPWGFIIFIALLIIIFSDEVLNIVKILSGNEKTAKDADDINDIINRLNSENKVVTENEVESAGENNDDEVANESKKDSEINLDDEVDLILNEVKNEPLDE